MPRILLPTVLLIALISAPAVQADGLRCGNELVQRGDSIVSVEKACGEPMRKSNLVNDYGKVIGTVLYFEGGYGRSDRRVVFRGGRVVDIERLR